MIETHVPWTDKCKLTKDIQQFALFKVIEYLFLKKEFKSNENQLKLKLLQISNVTVATSFVICNFKTGLT